jgi:heme/copper-type cytochrome/quinol oxidase subunit 2
MFLLAKSVTVHAADYNVKFMYEAQFTTKTSLQLHAQNMVRLSIAASAFTAPSI